jgi:hypothetical protein
MSCVAMHSRLASCTASTAVRISGGNDNIGRAEFRGSGDAESATPRRARESARRPRRQELGARRSGYCAGHAAAVVANIARAAVWRYGIG